MEAQIIALAIFCGIFTLATLRKVHLGVIMFAAAAGVGIWLADMKLSEVVDGFPVSILVLLVGVTYFFAIAQANGTVDKIIDRAVARVGDRSAILPFVFFAITAGISAMGSPLAGLVMTPVGMPLAKKYGIDRMLMGLAIGCGLSAGGFAPTSLFGIVTYGTAHAVDIDLNPLVLFAVALVANLVLLCAAFLMFGGLKLVHADKGAALALEDRAQFSKTGQLPNHPYESEGYIARSQFTTHKIMEREEQGGVAAASAVSLFTGTQRITIVCMAGLIVSVVSLAVAGRDPDIGILCFVFASVMTLVDPITGKSAVGKIDWSTVPLVGGIITFVGVLQNMGAVDLLGAAASQIGTPLVAALCICIIGGLISAFASTTGMLAALVPLAIPLVSNGGLAGWAVIAALGVCSSIVDVSPFSTVGATLVATVDEDERPRMNKLLTRWGLSMVVVGPLALVGALVAPTMF
ncbi:C4-dicarboxylate ABC transporter [Arthrobacter sp. MYb211]|uniref:SLC13 family permease n=1 Tax=unclassified Arthrobacter TaxID=235627 RepID=UPI000CFB4D80|nr:MULTISPECIES: SLC13 family permease [unclassified Arthrobacter]PRA12353.1 C4-dicarboxylate ABC transporter [Arthrobacter sp. MYb221]PRC08816.1 C4-dicarboxylate ABC transporter [Arthrobacter sp. MYb211]